MSKQIDGNYLLSFTTDDDSKLPKPRQMQREIQEVLAAALDSYLHKKGISGNEVHLILCDDFTIEDYENN